MRSDRIYIRDICYRRTFQGAWALAAIVRGYREERQYMGYTKREATTMFLREMNGGNR